MFCKILILVFISVFWPPVWVVEDLGRQLHSSEAITCFQWLPDLFQDGKPGTCYISKRSLAVNKTSINSLAHSMGFEGHLPTKLGLTLGSSVRVSVIANLMVPH